MGSVLANTFMGEHRWIASDGILLDCMFFSSTSEKLEDDISEKTYKDKPTFILCNPNAMFY